MFNIFKKSSKQTEQKVKYWYYENHVFLQNIQEQNSYFLDQWLLHRYQEPKKYYQALKSFILFLQDTKQLCKSKGGDFEKWFDDVIASDEYISDRIQELSELEIGFRQLSDEYIVRKNALENIDKKILDCISENPGILQKDLYCKFETCVRNDISEKIYFFSKNGVVKRVKHGNTYALYLC